MPQIVIENPILHSAYEEPCRQFRFTEEGITGEVSDDRRISSYFIPIPQPKKKSARRMAFEAEWTTVRIEEYQFINSVRERVTRWRRGGCLGLTRTTAQLLAYSVWWFIG